jgi:hypothetical protein
MVGIETTGPPLVLLGGGDGAAAGVHAMPTTAAMAQGDQQGKNDPGENTSACT